MCHHQQPPDKIKICKKIFNNSTNEYHSSHYEVAKSSGEDHHQQSVGLAGSQGGAGLEGSFSCFGDNRQLTLIFEDACYLQLRKKSRCEVRGMRCSLLSLLFSHHVSRRAPSCPEERHDRKPCGPPPRGWRFRFDRREHLRRGQGHRQRCARVLPHSLRVHAREVRRLRAVLQDERRRWWRWWRRRWRRGRGGTEGGGEGGGGRGGGGRHGRGDGHVRRRRGRGWWGLLNRPRAGVIVGAHTPSPTGSLGSPRRLLVANLRALLVLVTLRNSGSRSFGCRHCDQSTEAQCAISSVLTLLYQ